jgi:hypothetical protein
MNRPVVALGIAENKSGTMQAAVFDSGKLL